MWLPSFFVLVVYVSGYLFLLFAAICLACGFYYLAELVEEYTSAAKKVLRVVILIMLGVFVVLWAYERFYFVYCAIGFASHLMYYQLLKSFPFLQPKTLPFIGSGIMFVINNVAWYRYFNENYNMFYNYRLSPTPSIASFFLLCVWMVPIGFFVSLTVNDSVLPGAGLDAPSSSRDSESKEKKSKNLVAATVDETVKYFKRLVGREDSRGTYGRL
uniref:Protein TEX261 n=1 Tax=Rhodosorus marinus TaxID=101924 RepID=A0A7S2ZLN4_9RHOD|mmetsp:Transcript_23449/g.93059  ORF Transcript_23449/g.93059 Transcript_23449/m.93059 type:complete len:215 (+) Transcript_23449:308-952(+)